MIKKIFVVLSLSTFLTSLSFATDLLAFYTNGKLSDNSPGVKVLSLEEKKQVRGGYLINYDYSENISTKTREFYVIAKYSENETNNLLKGLCGIDQASCSNPSLNRLIDYLSIVDYSANFSPVYIVKRQVQYSNLGRPYVLFSYGVGVIDYKNQIYKFNSTYSSSLLNNNMIIKEMANKYKDFAENIIGGWSVR